MITRVEGQLQAAVLAALGATPAEVGELLLYNQNRFAVDRAEPLQLPLPDEPFVRAWEGYASAAREAGAHAVLCRVLPQLRFPIRQGISQEKPYRAVTRGGDPVDECAAATGLAFERPDRLAIVLHASAAGRIPLLVCRHRRDFVTLVQALTARNEPEPVPDAKGAVMVSGYINWDRVAALRREWEAAAPETRAAATWKAELARLAPRRELYQDRFILLSDGPYSAVPAAAMELDDEPWRDLSLAIRREHECAHYFTRRLFGSMRNNVLDELIADYAGIAAVAGRFRADWFLRFVGLDCFPAYRAGARLDLYRGDPPLSPGSFAVLCALLRAAAVNLESWDAGRPRQLPELLDRALVLTALATLRLEDLAASAACRLLAGAHERVRRIPG
jgi:hypothetical protein